MKHEPLNKMAHAWFFCSVYIPVKPLDGNPTLLEWLGLLPLPLYFLLTLFTRLFDVHAANRAAGHSLCQPPTILIPMFVHVDGFKVLVHVHRLERSAVRDG